MLYMSNVCFRLSKCLKIGEMALFGQFVFRSRINEQNIWTIRKMETSPIGTGYTGLNWHHTLAIMATLM